MWQIIILIILLILSGFFSMSETALMAEELLIRNLTSGLWGAKQNKDKTYGRGWSKGS